MKVHKLEIIVCDPNEAYEDIEDVITEIDNSCDLIFHYISRQTKEAGEWNDNSPFNFGKLRAKNAFNRLK